MFDWLLIFYKLRVDLLSKINKWYNILLFDYADSCILYWKLFWNIFIHILFIFLYRIYECTVQFTHFNLSNLIWNIRILNDLTEFRNLYHKFKSKISTSVYLSTFTENFRVQPNRFSSLAINSNSQAYSLLNLYVICQFFPGQTPTLNSAYSLRVFRTKTVSVTEIWTYFSIAVWF